MNKFKLEDSLGFIINRAAVCLKRELHNSFKENSYKVTPEQWAILNRLWEQEGLSQVELAELTFRDKPNVGRMLEVLVKEDLVYRKPDENDKRVYRVFLTKKGKNLKDKLVPLAMDVLAKGQKSFSVKEISLLKKMINKLYKNLE